MKKAKKSKKKHDPPKPVVLEPAAESPEELASDPVQPARAAGSIVVTFTGDPGDPHGTSDPPVINYRGKDFPKGESVTIDDVRWIREHGERVRANRHFKVEG